MCDRVEMLEATLDLIEEGVAILDRQSNVLFWNKVAADLTGHPIEEVVARPCPCDLYCIDEAHRARMCGSEGDAGSEVLHEPTLVSMSHKLGHSIPGMLRKVALCDAFGEPSGTVLLFYQIEEMDKLPHGECGAGANIERCQADMEDRLEAAHHQWVCNRMPFGLLWVTVDQAQELRKTHGGDACEAMLRTVEQTLLRQMKPAEVLGRWGCNEFLVLTHERTAEFLLEHAHRLAGITRTADFRWWGDRIELTLSIGASQAIEDDTLHSLLVRARNAMQASQYAGGNHVTEARRNSCSKS